MAARLQPYDPVSRFQLKTSDQMKYYHTKPVRKKVLRRLISSIFYTVCIIGFIWQSSNLTALYFRYNAVTELFIEIPTELDAPDLSICIIYVQLFNSTILRNLTGKSFYPETIPYTADVEDLVTVADIFNYTPPTENLFRRCEMRLPQDYYYFFLREGSKCEQLFKITKYFGQEYMCYRFSMSHLQIKPYRYKNLAYALNSPGMFYSVHFNLTTFRHFDLFKAIIHPTVDYPYKSAAFASEFNRKIGSDLKAQFNMFYLRYSTLLTERLPAPYSTNCFDYGSVGLQSSEHCYTRCIAEKTVIQFKKLPFSSISIEPLKYKHISSKDLMNKTFAEQLNVLEVECNEYCKRPDCKESYFQTIVIETPHEDEISFRLDAPREPTMTTISRPQISFQEYFIFILSCFGTWFGISVASLNPVDWIHRKGWQYFTKKR